MSWSATLHFAIIFLLAWLLAGIQTSFWFQVFGSITPPLLWLVVFTYVALYREGIGALFQLMLLGLMLAAFSGSSVKVFYLSLTFYFLVLYFIKGRIFWSGSSYFLLMCAIGAVSYHLIFFAISFALDRSGSDFLILQRLTQILLTPSFALPIYWLLSGVDSLFIRRGIKADVPAGATYE